MVMPFRSVNFKGGEYSSGDKEVKCVTILKRILDKYGANTYEGQMKMNAYTILVGEPEGNRPLGILRWDDNTKMDLGEIGWDGMDWIIWLRIGTNGGLL
jgi:hypothetical protein